MSVFDQLASALDHADAIVDGRHPVPGKGMRKAAVLILLSDDDDPRGPRIILTERAAHLRKHAGQVSFPGGSRDGDETPEQTALREAAEECAIDSAGVRVLGRLPASSLPVTSFAVTPVVGVWESAAPLEMVPDPSEVTAIHAVPVRALSDPVNRGTWHYFDGHEGPAFVYGDLVIWGFTAMLLDGLLELADWAQPWDRERVIMVPRRFGGR
ncbi:NUDIX hydrolase [Trueperella sp.]|uniref:NUDIX hydrolase n=1 Tax=Trueperella sp. TaxID=2699835 RepID=UPI003734D99C